MSDYLKSRVLAPSQFTPFIREAEEHLEKLGRTICIYWSSHDANQLLPSESALKRLYRLADNLFVISSNGPDEVKDENTFLIMSEHSSVYIDFLKLEEQSYLCRGSISFNEVFQRYKKLAITGNTIKTTDTLRIESAVEEMKFKHPEISLFSHIHSSWNASADNFGGEDPNSFSGVPSNPL